MDKKLIIAKVFEKLEKKDLAKKIDDLYSLPQEELKQILTKTKDQRILKEFVTYGSPTIRGCLVKNLTDPESLQLIYINDNNFDRDRFEAYKKIKDISFLKKYSSEAFKLIFYMDYNSKKFYDTFENFMLFYEKGNYRSNSYALKRSVLNDPFFIKALQDYKIQNENQNKPSYAT